MGQANRRGTFEQRKAQAIAEGREINKEIDKLEKMPLKDPMLNPEEAFLVIAALMATKRGYRR